MYFINRRVGHLSYKKRISKCHLPIIISTQGIYSNFLIFFLSCVLIVPPCTLYVSSSPSPITFPFAPLFATGRVSYQYPMPLSSSPLNTLILFERWNLSNSPVSALFDSWGHKCYKGEQLYHRKIGPRINGQKYVCYNFQNCFVNVKLLVFSTSDLS